MWAHALILLSFGVLFLRSKGLFDQASSFLIRKFPQIMKIQKRSLRLCLMIVFWGNAMGAVLTLSSTWSHSTVTDGYLQRPDKDGEGYESQLEVQQGQVKEEVTLQIEPQRYTQAEVEEMMTQAAKSLEQKILGRNQSLEEVYYPLELITEDTEHPVTISWNSSDPLILDWEGQIGQEVPQEGTDILLTAELSCQGQMCQESLQVHVFPEKLTQAEELGRQLSSWLQEQMSQEGDKLYLPQELNGKALSWREVHEQQGLIITVLSCVVGLLWFLREESQRGKEEQLRRQQMLWDYPYLMNKLVLFLKAGLSTRRAFRKIALDYRKDLQRGKERRYAYEEILKTYYEMENGMSEADAYERLGERCKVPAYKTFATLLLQNLQKGSSRFLEAMELEGVQAFEERKKQARIQGEVAGTKLLFPMMLMLLLVLLILMVPAVLSFL